MMTMIGPFSIDTYLPSFPDIERDFEVSRAVLSQSLGFYLLAFAIGTLILGPLADRLGRRWVIIISLFIYTLASIACALADNFTAFLLFRILQGSAAAGNTVSGRAMIRDVFGPQEAQRAMSRIMMMFAIAPALAPIIGGLLHDWFGWHSVFYFLAAFSVGVMLLVFAFIPESLPVSMRQSFHPVKVTKVYFHTLVHRRFLKLILIIAVTFAGLFLYVVGSPTVIYEFLHLGSSEFYVLFVPLVAGLVIGAWISGRLSHNWPMVKTVKLGLLLFTIGSLLNAAQAQWLPPMTWSTVSPLIFYTCGIGIALPALTVLSLDCFPHNRGSAAAMQSFTQMTGNAMVSSIVVPILDELPIYLAAGQVGFIACAWLLWWRVPRENTNP